MSAALNNLMVFGVKDLSKPESVTVRAAYGPHCLMQRVGALSSCP